MSQIPQDEKHDYELRHKNEEIQRLKEKIKNEMINKIALPDLMETMLADKNEEIDHLKEQIEMKENELKAYRKLNLNLNENDGKELQRLCDADAREDGSGKISARTLSDIVSISSEYDEPDVIRKCVDPPGALEHEGFTFNIHSGISAQHMVSVFN